MTSFANYPVRAHLQHESSGAIFLDISGKPDEIAGLVGQAIEAHRTAYQLANTPYGPGDMNMLWWTYDRERNDVSRWKHTFLCIFGRR